MRRCWLYAALLAAVGLLAACRGDEPAEGQPATTMSPPAAAQTPVAAVTAAAPTGSPTAPLPLLEPSAGAATPSPRPPTATTVPSPTPALITTTLETGWVAYQLPGQGFAVTLPPRWRPLDLSPDRLDETLLAIQGNNPGIRGLVSAQMLRGQLASGLAFYALHLAPETFIYDTPTTISVVRLGLQVEVPFETYVQQRLRQIEGLVIRNTPIFHQPVALGNVTAERFQYNREITGTTGQFISVRIVQYLVVDGFVSYVITLTCPVQLADTYAPFFDEIGRSFTLLN